MELLFRGMKGQRPERDPAVLHLFLLRPDSVDLGAACVVHCIDESLLGGSFVEKVRRRRGPKYSWSGSTPHISRMNFHFVVRYHRADEASLPTSGFRD
jgi:hypothetical protein